MLPFLPSRRALFGGVAIMGGGPLAKTYADFLAHITTLAVNGSLGASVGGGGKFRRLVQNPLSGDMIGTPWGSYFTVTDAGAPGAESGADRVIQHSLPSQALAQLQATNGWQVYLDIQAYGAAGPFAGLNRNSYVSIGDGSTINAAQVIDVVFWDGTQALRNNPANQTGPVPYVAPGWQ